MTGSPRLRSLAAGSALVTGLGLLAGCTAEPTPTRRDPAVSASALRLVAFDSCQDALGGLKAAAKKYVGPYGFGGPRLLDAGEARAGAAWAGDAEAVPGQNAAKPDTTSPNYSGTNTHEAGVDEPDLVKTDGRRIVTVSRGVLWVVDPASRTITGRLDLRRDGQDPVQWQGVDMLLHGDRALLLIRENYWRGQRGAVLPEGPGAPGAPPPPGAIVGPRLLLVDLSGQPRVVSEYRVDGGLVDARQVGNVARIVVRSAPRLVFPYRQDATDAQRLAANRAIIDRADEDAWLPRYEVLEGGRTEQGRVGCDRVSRPTSYSGTSMITVLSFDLGTATLGNGDPVTVVADGDTVYSNGPSLYLANDRRWQVVPTEAGGAVRPKPTDVRTEIYKFDTSRSGRPRYVAAGSVQGWLINQYAMSEWDGHLRVATTTGQPWDTRAKSSSTVYVLRQSGDVLRETGKVGGLGKGERIYAVRFTGATGYVVTFRQTDPLYTVDLSNPKVPTLTGELKITGYSAYLHPIGDGRLLGVGQQASEQGRVQGTQVSLFDVSDLARPSRLARYHVRYGNSEAEFDPHAFLWWPSDRLLVVPLSVYDPQPGVGLDGRSPTTGALLLRVGEAGFTELGLVSHPRPTDQRPDGNTAIRRSLVVDGVLWTVSDAGLQATSLSTLDRLSWIPLN